MKSVRAQTGVGLIEVLVSLLILSIAVLGFAGLQLQSLRASGEAQFRVQAMSIAQDLAERIKNNPDQNTYYRTTANWTNGAEGSPGTTCVSAYCTAATMAQYDRQEITYMAQHYLPNGKVSAGGCQGATDLTCVYVSWNETDPTAGASGECVDASSQFVNGADCVMLEVY